MDTLQALNQLDKTIRRQREQMLRAHGVLTCLYETLLHEECEQAVSYAQAADVVRGLIDASAEELDSVRISPLLEVIGEGERVDESRVLCTG